MTDRAIAAEVTAIEQALARAAVPKYTAEPAKVGGRLDTRTDHARLADAVTVACQRLQALRLSLTSTKG